MIKKYSLRVTLCDDQRKKGYNLVLIILKKALKKLKKNSLETFAFYADDES